MVSVCMQLQCCSHYFGIRGLDCQRPLEKPAQGRRAHALAVNRRGLLQPEHVFSRLKAS